MKNIYLISSLGMSPGVVTGVIDVLQYSNLEETYDPVYIAIITTDHKLTRLSLKVIEKDISKFNPHIKIIPYIIKGLSDIHTREDNLQVMKTFVNALHEGERFKKRDKVEEIHLNIAGGRKTMSGVFTSLSNIFPVDKVYHLLTSPEIEQNGHIKNFLTVDDTLKKDLLENKTVKKILHPKVTQNQSILVEIPLLKAVDFQELLKTAKHFLKEEKISNYKMAKMLIRNRIIEPINDNKYKPTKEGGILFDLLKHYLSL